MRPRNLVIATSLTLVAVAVMAVPALAGDPSIPLLKRQLRDAKRSRNQARHHYRRSAVNLAGARELFAATSARTDGQTPEPTPTPVVPPATMDAKLAALLLADGVVTADEVAALRTRCAAAKRLSRRWTAKVRRLQRRIGRLRQIAEWNRRGCWKPLVEIAGHKYGVSHAGLYRMMMLESGGNRTAGGMFKGLFQYLPSTWAGSWNPWRHHSVHDGWAQIRATAYALRRGMGPSQWPNTYPMAF